MRRADQMITGIGSVGFTGATGTGHKPAKMVTSGLPVPPMEDEVKTGEASANPAATLAAQGAPVDMDKVAAVRAGIANGTYKVDAKAIADAMIAQDLPARA
jgi:flagellar biosynthesis anti-sigma factor FlgM